LWGDEFDDDYDIVTDGLRDESGATACNSWWRCSKFGSANYPKLSPSSVKEAAGTTAN
jgi:hypothetical protein